MLRNGKLASPGPEVFLALGSTNQWLADNTSGGKLDEPTAERLLTGHGELFEALLNSALPVLEDTGRVLGSGDLLELFVGLRPPPQAFDLRIAAEEAPALCAALATLLTADRSWRQCRHQLMEAYPVDKRQRRERFAEVMAGQRDYSASELDAELPDLRRTLAALGAAGEEELSADRFLALLRNRARQHGPSSNEAREQDLAEAIRRELGVARE